LTGDPNYGIILQAYPFIARKLLQSDRPEIQTALQQVLYGGEGLNSGLKLSRLLALLNNAAGSVATQDGAVFVDIDAVPEDGITFEEGLKFLLSDKAESLRKLLEPEVDSIVDILVRQIFRKGVNEAVIALTPPRPPSLPFLGNILPPSPKLDETPLPFLLPGFEGAPPSVRLMSIQQLTDLVAPKLSQDDELFALGLADAAEEFFGKDLAEFVRGDSVFSAQSMGILLSSLRSGAFDKVDFLSPRVIENITESASRVISLVRGTNTPGTVDLALQDAVDKLDASERERLKEIVNELTRRTIARLLARISDKA
jgi:hypothetical protein